jgi:hypothetical protein
MMVRSLPPKCLTEIQILGNSNILHSAKIFLKSCIVFDSASHNLTLSCSHLGGSRSHVIVIEEYRKLENTKVDDLLVL